MNILRVILFPLAVVYGLVVGIRNKLFDWGILPQRSHPIPIIGIGNLSLGGTGKTPLTEYIVRLLQTDYSIATLSRGYGRKTKGFVLADENANAFILGDESAQYATKFPNIAVAVDANRNRGVDMLRKSKPNLEVILLDDAFQHRYIRAGLSILLTDFYHLYSDDYIFPSGTLRESCSGAKRADIVVVTKTPAVLSPITRRRISQALKLKNKQLLLFSKIDYGLLTPFSNLNSNPLKKQYSHILLFTGIANNYPLQDHLRQFSSDLSVLTFSDHHDYTENDIRQILKAFEDIFSKNKILVTTEKDAMRLKAQQSHSAFKEIPFYYVPIFTAFHNGDQEKFSKAIKGYIGGMYKK
ncbi:MAG TPA: tetraacyldisaccharide 4'-kinase [Bacteroidales bacterium]|nr:tetraacyldisaccharide 4'-kinase [Bacteroidales bacterium]